MIVLQNALVVEKDMGIRLVVDAKNVKEVVLNVMHLIIVLLVCVRKLSYNQ